MSLQFYRSEPTARTAWRQAILMGANVRTYKFPLGAALLDLARSGRDAVPLVELATAYSTRLIARAGEFPQAPSTQSMGDQDFLSVLSREREESRAAGTPTETLVNAAVRSIPGMVMQKFHNLPGQGKVAHRFYELEGRGSNRIVRLTPDLRSVAVESSGVLDDELDARWKIVEASFDAGIGRNLMGGLRFDDTSGQLVVTAQRVPLTSLRASIDGFQYGRCFYCHEPLGDLNGPDIHVDHVFPFKWMTTGSWRGPDLNGVWNLVLAHEWCNRKKWFRNPTDDEIRRLIARNDAIAESPVPLRRTLEIAMNASGPSAAAKRRQFVANVRNLTTAGQIPGV
jgi:hypothetical protein